MKNKRILILYFFSFLSLVVFLLLVQLYYPVLSFIESSSSVVHLSSDESSSASQLREYFHPIAQDYFWRAINDVPEFYGQTTIDRYSLLSDDPFLGEPVDFFEIADKILKRNPPPNQFKAVH